MKTLKGLQGLDHDKLAKAIEADAGQAIPGLRDSLKEAAAGQGAMHTPARIDARKPGRPAGSIKAGAKVATNIRFDPDVLQALKESGPGWQTRANDLLRADIKAGRLKKLSAT